MEQILQEKTLVHKLELMQLRIQLKIDSYVTVSSGVHSDLTKSRFFMHSTPVGLLLLKVKD